MDGHHSIITLTMDRYTHVAFIEVARALEKLPEVALDKAERKPQEPKKPVLSPWPKLAGRLAVGLAVNGVFSCPKASAPVRRGGVWPLSQETTEPLDGKGVVSNWPGLSSPVRVRLMGLEPMTYGLKVRCSTD